ncbi:MAG: hypothetical protein ABUL46_04615, partial [Chitinophaga rupis]
MKQLNLDFNDPGLMGVLKILQGLNSVIVFALPALLYARLTFGQHPGYYLGLRPVRKTIFYGLAVALLLFSIPLEGWLGELNKMVHLPPSALKMEEEADRQINAFLRVDSPKDIFV